METTNKGDAPMVLIVVDMQNDFIDGSLKIDGSMEIIPTIKKEITSGKYQKIIFT